MQAVRAELARRSGRLALIAIPEGECAGPQRVRLHPRQRIAVDFRCRVDKIVSSELHVTLLPTSRQFQAGSEVLWDCSVRHGITHLHSSTNRFLARTMKVCKCGSVAILCIGLWAGTVQAQVPSVINYQGKLVNEGAPADGTFTITFSLYDEAEGGSALWRETHSVQVTDGLFHVLLGSSEPLPVTLFGGSGERFLGLQVGGDSEMAPRFRLTSVPYALKAAAVSDASVDSSALADHAVSAPKLADGAVSERVLADGAVTGRALADGAVSGAKIATGEVVTSFNGLAGAVALVEGSNITITQEENSLTISGISNPGNTLDAAYDQGGPGAGRAIQADNGAVHIAGDGGLVVEGPTALGATTINEELVHKGSTLRLEGSEVRLGTNDDRDRGDRTEQRALVHLEDDALSVNFRGDFEGGTVFSSPNGSTNLFVSGANGGNVGVGTSNPASRLEVEGTIHAAEGGFKFPDGTVQSTALRSDAVTSEMIADGEVRSADLASNSVNRSKIADEPGLNYGNNGQPATPMALSGTGQSFASVTLNAPSDGIALVMASASVLVNHTVGTSANIVAKISTTAGDVAGIFGFGTRSLRIPPEWPSTTESYVTTVPVFAVFAVEAGTTTFHLNAYDSRSTGNASVLKPEIVATFLPTRYGSGATLPSESASSTVFGGGSPSGILDEQE